MEQLPRNLVAGDTQQRLHSANDDTVRSLLRYLLENSRQQTAEAALIAVGHILNMLTNSSVQVERFLINFLLFLRYVPTTGLPS